MKRIFSYLLLLVVVTTSFLASGCLNKSEGKVLASYDGGQVTESEFQEAISDLPERVRVVALSKKKDFLDSYVSEKLLLQEAESKGLQHLKDVEKLIRKARDRILVAKLVEEEVESKSNISTEEAKTYYDNHKEEFVTPLRLKASHILLRSREEAEDILTRINSGESFEELAKTHSLDPSAVKGGDIGYFQKGQLIPEIEEVAFGLQKDEVSGVVQSPFGFHVVKLTGEAKPQTREFSLVEKEIKAKLILDKKTENFNTLVEKLKNKSNLEISDDAVEEFEFNES